jgi:hypothetical protein
MKNLKLLALLFVCTYSVNAQDQKIVDEIYVSAKNGHYFRAERFIDQLRWELKVKEVANLENYKLAYTLTDSVKHYKKISIPLDVSKATLTEENGKLDKEIKDLKVSITEGLFEKTIAVLGKIKIQLAIKDAKENMQSAKLISQEALLVAYLKNNTANLKSKKKSVNAFKIDSLTKSNQIKIAELEKELKYRRKASIHIGTYEIQHEFEKRSMLEGDILKGDKKEIERIETFLKSI